MSAGSTGSNARRHLVTEPTMSPRSGISCRNTSSNRAERLSTSAASPSSKLVSTASGGSSGRIGRRRMSGVTSTGRLNTAQKVPAPDHGAHPPPERSTEPPACSVVIRRVATIGRSDRLLRADSLRVHHYRSQRPIFASSLRGPERRRKFSAVYLTNREDSGRSRAPRPRSEPRGRAVDVPPQDEPRASPRPAAPPA